jgi:hypothetical protein
VGGFLDQLHNGEKRRYARSARRAVRRPGTPPSSRATTRSAVKASPTPQGLTDIAGGTRQLNSGTPMVGYPLVTVFEVQRAAEFDGWLVRIVALSVVSNTHAWVFEQRTQEIEFWVLRSRNSSLGRALVLDCPAAECHASFPLRPTAGRHR